MRSLERDCVLLEPGSFAVVLGEPAVELWARLRADPKTTAALKTTEARRRTPCHY